MSRGARTGRAAVVTILCFSSSRPQTETMDCPRNGRSVVIADGAAMSPTTSQPGTEASTDRVHAPTPASRSHTSAGPEATNSATALHSPIRPATCASRDSSSSTGEPSPTATRSISEARGRRRGNHEDPTPSIPTPRGPVSHFRDVAYTTSGPQEATSTCPRACAASSHSGTPNSRHTAATSPPGWTSGRCDATSVRCTNAGGAADRSRRSAPMSTRPAGSTASQTGRRPRAANASRFGPHSLGATATLPSAGSGHASSNAASDAVALSVNAIPPGSTPSSPAS